MQPPRRMTWRRVAVDDIGQRYDIDQDFNAVLSDPIITKNDDGEIKQVVGSLKKVSKISRSLSGKGKRLSEPKPSKIKFDIQSLTLSYPMDENLRRLALKMSIGCLSKLGRELRISNSVRLYLLAGSPADSNIIAPVRVALDRYNELDSARPLLGHLVYVRSNPDEGRSYSIIQFFGAIQLYCELGSEMKGDGFAILATHDPVSHREDFRETNTIDYALPPQSISIEDWKTGVARRFESMRQDLVELYRDQAPLSLSINS